jgi:hypothetical protein
MLAARLDGNPGVTSASRSAAEVLLDAALLDAALLRPAASPGAGSGRHRKQDQPAPAAAVS